MEVGKSTIEYVGADEGIGPYKVQRKIEGCGRTESSAPTKSYNSTQIFCTTGAYVDTLIFPRQRVLPSSCVATAPDGSVVPTQAAL